MRLAKEPNEFVKLLQVLSLYHMSIFKSQTVGEDQSLAFDFLNL